MELLYIDAIQFRVAAGKSRELKNVLNKIPTVLGLHTDYTLLPTD